MNFLPVIFNHDLRRTEVEAETALNTELTFHLFTSLQPQQIQETREEGRVAQMRASVNTCRELKTV